MKSFALAAVLLPLAMANVLPQAQLETEPLKAEIDLGLISVDFSGQKLDIISTMSKLLEAGELDITDVDTISRRSDVPFLHCGYARATRCAFSSGGVLATCFWAAISGGRDIKEDSKCVAAAAAFGSNLPNDCKLCLGM